MMADHVISAAAVISDCGKFRYRLSRIWRDGGHILPFVMLNPSTADAKNDDPTIRRCMGFARREGYSGIEVANLYAFRATAPVDLWKAIDPFGPDNDQHLMDVATASAAHGVPIICAWGAHGGNSSRPITLMQAINADLRCLGKTKDGKPRHPLYVKGDQPFEPLYG